MSRSMREKRIRDKLFLKMFLKDKGEVTQEELAGPWGYSRVYRPTVETCLEPDRRVR